MATSAAADVIEETTTSGESEPAKELSPAEKTKGDLLEETQKRNLDFLAGAQSLLTVVVLALCCVISFSSRLFAVIRFESIIHEFDPWCVCVCVCARQRCIYNYIHGT